MVLACKQKSRCKSIISRILLSSFKKYDVTKYILETFFFSIYIMYCSYGFGLGINTFTKTYLSNIMSKFSVRKMISFRLFLRILYFLGVPGILEKPTSKVCWLIHCMSFALFHFGVFYIVTYCNRLRFGCLAQVFTM